MDPILKDKLSDFLRARDTYELARAGTLPAGMPNNIISLGKLQDQRNRLETDLTEMIDSLEQRAQAADRVKTELDEQQATTRHIARERNRYHGELLSIAEYLQVGMPTPIPVDEVRQAVLMLYVEHQDLKETLERRHRVLAEHRAFQADVAKALGGGVTSSRAQIMPNLLSTLAQFQSQKDSIKDLQGVIDLAKAQGCPSRMTLHQWVGALVDEVHDHKKSTRIVTETLQELLASGLSGGNDYRLCLLACKGDALSEGELDMAERFERATKKAREVLRALRNTPPKPAEQRVVPVEVQYPSGDSRPRLRQLLHKIASHLDAPSSFDDLPQMVKDLCDARDKDRDILKQAMVLVAPVGKTAQFSQLPRFISDLQRGYQAVQNEMDQAKGSRGPIGKLIDELAAELRCSPGLMVIRNNVVNLKENLSLAQATVEEYKETVERQSAEVRKASKNVTEATERIKQLRSELDEKDVVIKQLGDVVVFVADHPRAAPGAGDTEHRDWSTMQTMAKEAMKFVPQAKTRVTVSLPRHAAEKILADPQAFQAYMAEHNFPIESISRGPDPENT